MSSHTDINCFGMDKIRRVSTLAMLFLAGVITSANRADGALLPLQNSSFEAPQLPSEGQQATNTVPGWKISGATGVFVNNGMYGNKMEGADGAHLAFLNGTQAA